MNEPFRRLHPVVIAAPSQSFFHLVLTAQEECYRLSFSVKDESNIRYYLIEGSHDMISFDRLTRIFAKGGSHLPRTYTATIHNTDYQYYRIRQVDDSNAAISLSIVAKDAEGLQPEAALQHAGSIEHRMPQFNPVMN